MSIVLRINAKTGGALSPPVLALSGMAAFGRLWLAGAEQIGALWIPLFSPGLDMEPGDIPALCDELRALKSWLAGSNAEAWEQAVVANRIDSALERLQWVNSHRTDVVKVFIGDVSGPAGVRS